MTHHRWFIGLVLLTAGFGISCDDETTAPDPCAVSDACSECTATSCASVRERCCATDGCFDIIACGREAGCSGVDCYAADTCQAVIDAQGGPVGAAAIAASDLGACSRQQCAAMCGGGTGGSGGGTGGTSGGTGGGAGGTGG